MTAAKAMNDNNSTVLEVQELTKVYPGTIALENVTIKFKRGEVHGIIGKNGAGKSTLVNILSGILSPSAGKIVINGREFARLTTGRAKKEGITIVTQKPEIVPDFNLVQNMFLPQYLETRTKLLKWKSMYSKAKQIFDQADFDIDLTRKMSDLSLDEEQVFLLLKAFYVDRQDLVLLDEVTTSFSSREQEYFFKLIEEQKKRGKSIIFISHRLDEILAICDRITVLRDGKVVDSIERIEANAGKLASMVVGEISYQQEIEPGAYERQKEQIEIKPGKVVLSIEGFNRPGVLKNISFTLKKGEILGIAGLLGSGRTEILKAISGIEPIEEGRVVLEGGGKQRFTKSWDALKSGIVYLTEDRDEEGLISIMSVRKNLTLSFLVRLAKNIIVNKRNEKSLVEKLIDNFEILTSTPEEEVENLSGGNRQKVLCGRVGSTKALVLLLDEPTKGIDVAAKASVLKIIKEKIQLDCRCYYYIARYR